MSSNEFIENSKEIVRKYVFDHDDGRYYGRPIIINVENQCTLLQHYSATFVTNFSDLKYECVLDGDDGTTSLYVYKLIDTKEI